MSIAFTFLNMTMTSNFILAPRALVVLLSLAVHLHECAAQVNISMVATPSPSHSITSPTVTVSVIAPQSGTSSLSVNASISVTRASSSPASSASTVQTSNAAVTASAIVANSSIPVVNQSVTRTPNAATIPPNMNVSSPVSETVRSFLLLPIDVVLAGARADGTPVPAAAIGAALFTALTNATSTLPWTLRQRLVQSMNFSSILLANVFIASVAVSSPGGRVLQQQSQTSRSSLSESSPINCAEQPSPLGAPCGARRPAIDTPDLSLVGPAAVPTAPVDAFSMQIITTVYVPTSASATIQSRLAAPTTGAAVAETLALAATSMAPQASIPLPLSTSVGAVTVQVLNTAAPAMKTSSTSSDLNPVLIAALGAAFVVVLIMILAVYIMLQCEQRKVNVMGTNLNGPKVGAGLSSFEKQSIEPEAVPENSSVLVVDNPALVTASSRRSSGLRSLSIADKGLDAASVSCSMAHIGDAERQALRDSALGVSMRRTAFTPRTAAAGPGPLLH